MTIDLHIVVSLIQLLVIGIGGLYFVWTMKSRLDLLIQETNIKHSTNLERFSDMDQKLEKLASTAMELVKQQMRMDHMDERLQEFSNHLAEVLKQNHSVPPRSRNKG